jgi:hypothetical protein
LKVTRFDATAELIIVPGSVWGRRGLRKLRLVLDTGSAETIIAPDVLDELGYSPREGEAITVTRSAIGKESGYLMRVTRFRALGFEVTDFRVNVLDLPTEPGSTGSSASASSGGSTARSDPARESFGQSGSELPPSEVLPRVDRSSYRPLPPRWP